MEEVVALELQEEWVTHQEEVVVALLVAGQDYTQVKKEKGRMFIIIIIIINNNIHVFGVLSDSCHHWRSTMGWKRTKRNFGAANMA
jgi:hypothetical protein